MTYHFYFKNSQPVYETEYMQRLKQFAVQEVFPAYVLKSDEHILTTWSGPDCTVSASNKSDCMTNWTVSTTWKAGLKIEM